MLQYTKSWGPRFFNFSNYIEMNKTYIWWYETFVYCILVNIKTKSCVVCCSCQKTRYLKKNYYILNVRHLLTTFYNQPNEIVAFDLIHYEGLGNVQPQFTPANSTVEYHGDNIGMVVKDGKI